VSILEEYMQNPRVSLVYSESMSSYSLRDGHVQQPVRVRYAYELMDAYDMFREGTTASGSKNGFRIRDKCLPHI